MIYFIYYLLIGCVAGIISGLLGFAGGIIVVPALTLVFAYQQNIASSADFHFASGTSLATMMVTVGVSALTYILRKNVLWDIVAKFLPGLIIGVIAGVACSSHFSTHILKIIFGIFLFLVAIKIFFEKEKESSAHSSPFFILFYTSILVGFVSGLLGIGIASLSLPLFLYLGVPLRKASGSCATLSFPVAIVGTVGFIWTGWSKATGVPDSTGYIYWPAFLGIIITSVIFAPLSACFADRVPIKILTRILAVLLCVMGVLLIIAGVQ
jgi:uncharacterized membrane protein YfcA